MRVLELGNYVVPAYAGMILAEQGARVVKWVNGRDPILGLKHGDRLWQWINDRKTLWYLSPELLYSTPDWLNEFDIVLDNFRPETLERWGIDPKELANKYDLVWCSMRSEVPGRSFDLLAQARSTMEFAPWAPYWIGDTAGGLWLAFKTLAMYAAENCGHYTIGQASVLRKLVEGELTMPDVDRSGDSIPWEVEPYRVETDDDGNRTAVVQYKGDEQREPVRDIEWQLANLWHDGTGRIMV